MLASSYRLAYFLFLSATASFVKLPDFVLALRIASMPAFVRGPVAQPEWNLQRDVLLDLSATCPHCSFVRELTPTHLRHLILPPAVTTISSGLAI